MERNFLAFINDNHLFKTAGRILLAVSGGLDSVVMADLFYRTAQPFAIAHVNFGLRGAESDTDALFVKNKAEQYGVPFHLARFDTAAVATERGLSVQMAARELRYTWFTELLQQYGYTYVATAHHQNDVLETMLLNLSRGTGLAGLHGIMSQRQHIVRPLLFATREQIATYAEEQQLTYREDSSNREDKYARNRIRHHVVPVLNELNPSLWQTLPHTVARLRAAESLMRAELYRSWQEVAELQGEQIILSTEKLSALAEPVFRLAEWLKPYGFTEAQAGQMVASLRRPVGQVFSSITHRITHERTGFVLEPVPALFTFDIPIPDWPGSPIEVTNRFQLSVEQIDNVTQFVPPVDPNVAYLDANRLQWPLTLRPWRQGDRFRPLGLNGHKLVSDLMNDRKLSRSEREQTVVLLSGGQIAWVVGLRIDHRFRVTNETTRMGRFIWSTNATSNNRTPY